MASLYAETRENIELRLTIGVLMGELDEEIAVVWRDAIRGLSDQEIGTLIRKTSPLTNRKATALMVRFLMERNYPFREVILYRTDDRFKRRMGIADDLDDVSC